MGPMFFGMLNPGSAACGLVITDIRSGRIPEGEFGTARMFQLFKDMISDEPNVRPEAEDIIKKCDEIIIELLNLSTD